MSTQRGGSRRQALARVGSVLVAPWIAPAALLGRAGAEPPSERVTVAVIGTGGRGTFHVRALLGRPEARIVAVCDPFRSRREPARQLVESPRDAGGCVDVADYRRVLDRPDVDAVVIASPEHWHAIHMVDAARAGKDIYGEKALSLTVAEGRVVVDTVRRYGRVLQVGTQQRSDHRFRRACELARSGRLGPLRRIEVGVPGGYPLPNAPTLPVPQDLDYDLWLGPSPRVPYNAVRCSSPHGWYHIYDHCVGFLQSWGVHHIDVALWGAPQLTGSTLSVEATASFPSDGLANTPVTWRSTLRSPDGLVLSFSDNGHHAQGCRFVGDDGEVHVRRGAIRAKPEDLLDVELGPRDVRLYESSGHHANFLACVRSRRDPVSPVEAGHAATTVTSLTDIAIRTGRRLEWSWARERFLEDPGADRLLRRSMRSPWSL